MIFDCFSFYNELDLLKIRLEELYPIVDKFVIVEGDRSFRGNNKEFIFYNNKDKFQKYKDKIIYLQYNFPIGELNLMHEHNQKNSLVKGFLRADKDDLILFGDIDEIPKREKLKEAVELIDKYDTITFDGLFCCYFLNGVLQRDNKPDVWMGSVLFKKYFYNGIQNLVTIRNKHRPVKDERHFHLENAGWHFSYLGDIETIRNKLTNWTHWREYSEFNDEEYLNQCIKDRVFMRRSSGLTLDIKEVDDSFPYEVKNNLKQYIHLIKEEG